jgi:hypothetical protein
MSWIRREEAVAGVADSQGNRCSVTIEINESYGLLMSTSRQIKTI